MEHSYLKTRPLQRGIIVVLLAVAVFALPVMAAGDPDLGDRGSVISGPHPYEAGVGEAWENGAIALVRGGGDIWIMNNDGSGQTQLTNSPEADLAPSWSPDGKQLAYLQSAETITGRKYYMKVMNADGTGQVTLTNVILRNSSYSTGSISWSPDGSKLAFTSFISDFDSEIFTINTDGSGRVNLTNDPSHQEGHPSFAPDGMRIAFSKSQSGVVDSALYLMNSDGTNVRRWGGDALFSDGHGVKWSPDSLGFLYRSTLWGDCDCLISQKINGTGFIFLISDYMGGPADWSPDGTKAVFSNLSGIFIIGAYATNSRPIYIGPPDGRQPDWQPLPVTRQTILAER